MNKNVRLLILLFALIFSGCRPSGQHSSNIDDFSERIRRAQLGQENVLRSRRLAEEWASKPALREGWFHKETLVPFSEKLSDLPLLELPESTDNLIKSVIDLVEQDKFTKEQIEKALNVKFDEGGHRSVIEKYNQSEIWFGKSKNGSFDNQCKVQNMENTQSVFYESAGEGRIRLGKHVTAIGVTEFLAIPLPAMATSDDQYRDVFKLSMLVPILYKVSKLNSKSWFSSARETGVNWLSWVYGERLMQRVSNTKGWFLSSSADGYLRSSSSAEQFSIFTSNVGDKITDWREPLGFDRAPVTNVSGAVHALAARVFNTDKQALFVAANANYSIRFSPITLSYEDRAPLVNCVELIIEKRILKNTKLSYDFRISNLESFENLLWQISTKRPTRFESGKKLLDFEQKLIFEQNIHNNLRVYRALSEQLNEPFNSKNLMPSRITTKASGCPAHEHRDGRISSSSLIGCIPQEQIESMLFAVEFLEGPRCIDANAAKNTLMNVYQESLKLTGQRDKRGGASEFPRFEILQNLSPSFNNGDPLVLIAEGNVTQWIDGFKIKLFASKTCLLMVQIERY